jgi:outer membrane biosynthesis protein TonB
LTFWKLPQEHRVGLDERFAPRDHASVRTPVMIAALGCLASLAACKVEPEAPTPEARPPEAKSAELELERESPPPKPELEPEPVPVSTDESEAEADPDPEVDEPQPEPEPQPDPDPDPDVELAELLEESTITQAEFDAAFRNLEPTFVDDKPVFSPKPRSP